MRKSQRRRAWFKDGYSNYNGTGIRWDGDRCDMHSKNHWFKPKSKVFSKHKLERWMIIYDYDRRMPI